MSPDHPLTSIKHLRFLCWTLLSYISRPFDFDRRAQIAPYLIHLTYIYTSVQTLVFRPLVPSVPSAPPPLYFFPSGSIPTNRSPDQLPSPSGSSRSKSTRAPSPCFQRRPTRSQPPSPPPAAVRLLPHPSGAPSSPRLTHAPDVTPASSSCNQVTPSLPMPSLFSPLLLLNLPRHGCLSAGRRHTRRNQAAGVPAPALASPSPASFPDGHLASIPGPELRRAMPASLCLLFLCIEAVQRRASSSPPPLLPVARAAGALHRAKHRRRPQVPPPGFVCCRAVDPVLAAPLVPLLLR